MSYKRKAIRLKNSTNYFNPDTSKTHNTFASPNSYQSRQVKIEGYENRLYWEFRYCEEHSGQTYFYTLTYNDKSIPVFDGQNCFNYEDLRWLLNGGFKKHLLRNYGTNFKYFVGAELGDGKGSRGMHNNPHYHILFFLRPADNSPVPYKPITPLEFRHIIRTYWQGFDEDEGKVDYRTARFGIAREGDNLGKVMDFRACCYVAKYVCKDAALKQYEKNLEGEALKDFRNKYSNKCRISQGVGDYALQFIDDANPRIKVPSKKGWKNRPINMYYYRKLYTTVVKDEHGNPIRILNDKGIKFKMNSLNDNIKKTVAKAKANVFCLDEELYNKAFYSLMNERVSLDFDFNHFKKYLNNNNKIFNDYAIYKLIYEDRYFKFKSTTDECDNNNSFPDIDIRRDYRRFLTPAYYSSSFSPNRLDLFLDGDTEGYISYSLHPHFLPNISVFLMLDTIADYLFSETDRQNQQQAEEVAKAKRFHKQQGVKEFYQRFNLF